MNAREEIHGLSRANVDLLERSAARAFLGCGISLLAGAAWLLTGPVAKADVVTDWNVTAGHKSLPCINIAGFIPFMAPFGPLLTNVGNQWKSGSDSDIVKVSRMTQTGRGSTNIPATTLSFNMVASIRGTVAIQDNRPRDEAPR